MGGINGKLGLGTAHPLGKRGIGPPRPPGAKGIQLGFQSEPSDNPRRIWEWAQHLGTVSYFFAMDFSFNPVYPISHPL